MHHVHRENISNDINRTRTKPQQPYHAHWHVHQHTTHIVSNITCTSPYETRTAQ